MANSIWITWENQVRNRSMAQCLNVKLYEIIHNAPLIVRYVRSIHSTLKILKSQRPETVYHQNPSIVLSCLLILCRRIYKYTLITDTHNAGLFPAEGRYFILNWVGKFIARHTDIVIIHNQSVKKHLPKLKRNAIVLSDPLPSVSSLVTDTNSEDTECDYIQITYICRWALDEPYLEVIEAANILEEANLNIRISMTGTPPKHIESNQLPSNLILTGFLSNIEYEQLLRESDGLVVLTTRTNSLNCGGYEALAYEKPCILTDNKVLKSFFGSSFLYTQNNADDIVLAVTSLISKLDHYQALMKQAKLTYMAEYDKKISVLTSMQQEVSK